MRTSRTRARLVAALLAGLVALVVPAVAVGPAATAAVPTVAGTSLAIGKTMTAAPCRLSGMFRA